MSALQRYPSPGPAKCHHAVAPATHSAPQTAPASTKGMSSSKGALSIIYMSLHQLALLYGAPSTL